MSEIYKMKNGESVSQQSGFSLVELSIALVCIGLLMAGTLFIVNNTKNRLNIKDTRDRMAVIADKLSIYAQQHDRLPCPASPIRQNKTDGAITQALHFGDERAFVGNVNNIERFSECYADNIVSRGILPYRALGLDEEYARDSWGRHFTYIVSPVSARYNFINIVDTTVARHAEHNITSTETDSLTPKFRFCHGMPTTPSADGIVNATPDDTNDFLYNNLPAGSFAYNRDSTAQETVLGATNPDIAYANDYAAAGIIHPHTRRLAFALISHGENGAGAYLADDTLRQLNNGDVGNPDGVLGDNPSEETNARGPINFPGNTSAVPGATLNNVISIEYGGPNAAAALRFDDLVMVKTQDQIYGRVGGESCVTP